MIKPGWVLLSKQGEGVHHNHCFWSDGLQTIETYELRIRVYTENTKEKTPVCYSETFKILCKIKKKKKGFLFKQFRLWAITEITAVRSIYLGNKEAGAQMKYTSTAVVQLEYAKIQQLRIWPILLTTLTKEK